MQIPGAFPDVLKIWWVSASPLAFLFAGRIFWEKTILTWSQGPQMVGFALWHIHPGFAVAGTLCLKLSMVATAVLGLGTMIPAAPGGLGTYELLGTGAFKLGGISASSALALTVAIHAWVFVANIAVGICLLAVRGVSLAQLRSRLGGS